MRLAILGTGYVGLVTGTCFSDFGNSVACIDKDAAKVDGLRQGRIPIYEPGLQELVERNTREGRLNFTTDLAAGIADGVGGIDDDVAIFECARQPAPTVHVGFDLLDALAGTGPLILEALVPFDREVSVVAVRSRDGEVRAWPLVTNEHRDGILACTLAPAPRLGVFKGSIRDEDDATVDATVEVSQHGKIKQTRKASGGEFEKIQA